MILADFKVFPRTGRIMGIDWGARRTGVAVSDATREFVFTRDAIVLPRGGDLAKLIADIATQEKVVGIVFGRPVHNDGTVSETAEAVRRCAAQTCTYIDLPIVFIDENLTSFAAQNDMGRVRVQDLKKSLDSASARVILENAIAMIRRLKD